METKINIAEILKNKPKGTKLYSSACGKCKLEEVDDKSFKISFYNSKFGFMNGGEGYLDKNGKLYDDGECIVFPSKEMRDWSKFAWKKGDILVNRDKNIHLIFEKFIDDTYTIFAGKHCYEKDYRNEYNYERKFDGFKTEYFTLETGDAAQKYLKTIEKRLGGKLNRETLEVEKPQSEFKDGDIVCISGMGYLAYGIVKSIDYSSKKLEYYVLNDMSTLKFEDWLSFEDRQIQPISETQRMILFDALAKEGKYWDAEKKQVINVKLEIKLQPFDKVLVRDSEDREWRISLFGYKDNSYYYCINGYSWKQCIPYEGNEHLLGTKNNPK